jgi:hypothetical protein
MKYLSHLYSFIISKIPKLHTQKCSNKEDMTKKPKLAQSFQKLITFTKHILFFWKFEKKNVLLFFIILSNFTSRSFHSRSRSRFKDLTSTTLDMLISSHLFSFFFSSHSFLSSFLFYTWQTLKILLETLKL